MLRMWIPPYTSLSTSCVSYLCTLGLMVFLFNRRFDTVLPVRSFVLELIPRGELRPCGDFLLRSICVFTGNRHRCSGNGRAFFFAMIMVFGLDFDGRAESTAAFIDDVVIALDSRKRLVLKCLWNKFKFKFNDWKSDSPRCYPSTLLRHSGNTHKTRASC